MEMLSNYFMLDSVSLHRISFSEGMKERLSVKKTLQKSLYYIR